MDNSLLFCFFHLANTDNVENTCALIFVCVLIFNKSIHLFCSLTVGFPPLAIALSYELDILDCNKAVLTLAD